MNFTRQFLALLRMNVAALPQRLGLVLTIVIGVACAVGVLVSMLAMGVGARREAMGNVRPDRIIVPARDKWRRVCEINAPPSRLRPYQ